MKRFFMLMGVVMVMIGSMAARADSAPPEVLRSAVSATEALGKKVVMGNHKAAIDQMYPRWRQRLAKRKGGPDELERELAGIAEMMARNGMSLISFKTIGEPSAHEVWPGEEAGGGTVYTKWVVLVPTATRLRYMEEGQPKAGLLDLYGFQVAIADKGSDDWTFINGSDVSVADLRSLFTSLPANLSLPEVKREVVE